MSPRAGAEAAPIPPASLWVITGPSRQPPPWDRAVRTAGLGSHTAPCHRDPAPGSGVAFVPARQGTCCGLCSVPVQPSPTPGEPRGRVEQEGKRCPMGWEQLAPGMGLGMCRVPCPLPNAPPARAGCWGTAELPAPSTGLWWSPQQGCSCPVSQPHGNLTRTPLR